MSRPLSQKQPDAEPLAYMRSTRCEECSACKRVAAAKPAHMPNPPFTHATDELVASWNKVVAENPCEGHWFCYQNEDLGHSQLGHMKFLQCGPGNTFKEPPERLPDTQRDINWRYWLVGVVNLSTGDILSRKCPACEGRGYRVKRDDRHTCEVCNGDRFVAEIEGDKS